MALDLSLKIDVVLAKDLSEDDFKRNYFIPQKPVLIKGLAYQQPAGKKWTIDFFRNTAGDEIVEVFDNRNKDHEKKTSTTADHKILLREFLSIIEKNEYTPLRMFVFNLFKLRKDIRKDFLCPEIFKGYLDSLGFFFMGGKNTEVRLHFDVDYNNVLLTQFHGKKQIVLIEPKYSTVLYKLPFNTHSNVNLDEPDYDKFPGLNYVKGYKFIQEPGDALFMPAQYWHYNVYLEGGIAISYRKLNRNPFNNILGILSLGLLVPFDKMMFQFFNDKWFNYKRNISRKRAEASIRKFRLAKQA
ncbi:MAG: cupin-like domain-containing protein [Bacteroidota bacterium]